MMRFGAALVGVLAFLLFIPAPYAAEDGDSEAPLFTPTSGWLVGPASLIPPEKDEKTRACVMANQFDNGVSFRFSGTSKAIKAMAIDFRQAAFKKGESREVTFRIGDDFDQAFDGVAYDSGTLLFSVQGYEADLFKALEKGKTLTLDVANHSLEFALLGVRDGLQRLGDCNGIGRDSNRQAMMEADEEGGDGSQMSEMEDNYAPGPMRRIDVAPVTKQEVKSVSSSPKIPEQKEQKQIKRDSALPDVAKKTDRADEQGQITKMKPTENSNDSILDAMLSKAQKALNPDPGGLGLKEPRMIEPAAGGDEEAVKPVVTRSASTAVPQADRMMRSASRDVVVPKPVPPDIPRIATPSTPDRRWRAMKGASLREVLDVWAVNSNVRLVWKTPQDYAVKRSEAVQGSFETAVEGLLNQYGSDSDRPTARLYNDPSSGQKVLVVGGEEN